jgi:hypothetical protein
VYARIKSNSRVSRLLSLVFGHHDMNLGTLSKSALSNVQEVARTEVRILWVNDFYDGPLQGVAEVHGARYLFDIIDREALGTEDESRMYWLIALSPEQWREEVGWHELFCRKVGTHFDYTGRPVPPAEEVCPDEFYEPYRHRKQTDYSDNEVIGWFRL